MRHCDILKKQSILIDHTTYCGYCLFIVQLSQSKKPLSVHLTNKLPMWKRHDNIRMHIRIFINTCTACMRMCIERFRINSISVRCEGRLHLTSPPPHLTHWLADSHLPHLYRVLISINLVSEWVRVKWVNGSARESLLVTHTLPSV